ncbi:MAG: V-type ATP synthase subunit D [Methanomicrobiales archaeon]|nr:V-type ATP synthase subunit D [Methanomicrobiales archaeon]
MEQVHPTRMELMKKNAQIRLAEQGRDLLKEKMDALIREFLRVVHTVSKSREELEFLSENARRTLLTAQAVDDSVALQSASFAAKRMVTLNIKGKNVMGVAVPVIEKRSFSRSICQRGYSIIGVSGRIDEVAERYERTVDVIIGLAETETALRRLGGEIQMTRRRVNALEQVLIPELKKQAKYISITIDEREREDIFRLKKVKKILDRKKKEKIATRRQDAGTAPLPGEGP